jgi:hypothetical protein
MIGALFGKFIATKVGQMIPPWLWEIVFIAALTLGGMLFHHIAVVRHDNQVRAEQKQSDEQAYAKKAQAIAKQAAELSAKIRSRNDEQIRTIDRNADTILLRGPGKASCPASTPAASGGHEQSGQTDASMDTVPPVEREQLIAMPFYGTIAFAKQNDECLVKLNSWNDWYTKYEAVIEKAK